MLIAVNLLQILFVQINPIHGVSMLISIKLSSLFDMKEKNKIMINVNVNQK